MTTPEYARCHVGRHVLAVRHPRHLAVLVAEDLLRVVAKKDLGLLKPENVTHGTASVDEFPRAGGITLVRDTDWPNMWRLRRPNGQLSDMVNLTRAKDAARSR
jgi:hypothetical protein